MFTWNFQYISKTRLADTLSQLMLNAQKGDILIRIHTAIHLEDEAVDLARFVKNLVPRAVIFGTSTSAVINWGKLDANQCVISVTQMEDCRVRSVLLPIISGDGITPIPAKELCKKIKKAVTAEDTKLMLAFVTRKYCDVIQFAQECNEAFPGVEMIGGVASDFDENYIQNQDCGFVFNENGSTTEGILVASVSGEGVETHTTFASGAQPVGCEMEVTETDGYCIQSIHGRPAVDEFLIDEETAAFSDSAMAPFFPFTHADQEGLPFVARLHQGKIYANYMVKPGEKIRRALVFDRRVISENRAMFRRVENFQKAETIFGYTGSARLNNYPNCVKWELSVYENSNICGCVTDGEFVYYNGRVTFANCCFAISVFGEKEFQQKYNPYAFTYVDPLSADNKGLLGILMDAEKRLETEGPKDTSERLKAFLRDCESRLLYSDSDDNPNGAALTMDVKLKGYDRICMINVLDISSMRVVFSDQMIQLTYRKYVEKCKRTAQEKGYHFYVLDNWQVAIGAPSYIISLADFTKDMEKLYRELFEVSEEYVAIVPIFCIVYNCTDENLMTAYNSARVEMMGKNVQFFVRDAQLGQPDEEGIRKKYQMVNVIHYAISHDAVIPYFQGIYDNKLQNIHHYEALMRLKDENGRIYEPRDFLAVARSFGLMYDSLSLIMIRKVFEKFKDAEGRSVSVNLGIRDVRNREIVEFIYDNLSTMKHPENFIFELLENEDVDDYNVLINFVDKIHELGGKISIDDFGSGYSNLQHIVSIQSDFIKIDGSIVRNCCTDRESENLIALIAGWKNLSTRNVKIVAEYVENDDIQKKLTIYNVDYSQGYLFSKPSPEL